MKLSNNRIIKKGTGNFHRAMETKYHIYFINLDVEKESSVRMYDRKMNLIHEKEKAYELFIEDLKSPLNFWKSELLKESLVAEKIMLSLPNINK